MKQKLTPSQRVAIWRKNNPEKRRRQWLKEWETRKNDSKKHESWLIKKRVWDKKYRSRHEIKQTPYSEG